MEPRVLSLVESLLYPPITAWNRSRTSLEPSACQFQAGSTPLEPTNVAENIGHATRLLNFRRRQCDEQRSGRNRAAQRGVATAVHMIRMLILKRRGRSVSYRPNSWTRH